MEKGRHLIGIGLLLLVGGILAGILLSPLTKGKEKSFESQVVEVLEQENAGVKTEINKKISEIRYIKEGEDYKELRITLDSLLYQKSDTSTYLLRKICSETVKKQDTIIEKQDFVIVKQQEVIKNDSLVKIVFKNEIKNLEEGIEKEKKNSKKNRWKGRLEGGGVGLVVGYLLGKKF